MKEPVDIKRAPSTRKIVRSGPWIGALIAVTLSGAAVAAESVDDIEPLLRSGKIETALRRLDAVLAEDPDNPKARFLKSLALAEEERYGEAIELLLNLTIDYPKAPQIYNNLGIIYTRVERYDDAVDMFKKAFRVDPDYAEAYENLGDIYAAMAGVAYTGALAIDAENTAVRDKLVAIQEFSKMVDRYEKKAPESARVVRPGTRLSAASPGGDHEAASRERAVAPETPLTEPVREHIEQRVRDWASAWSRGDVDRYMEFYDEGFEPGEGLSYDEWKRQRRQRLQSAGSIKVTIEDITISAREEDRADATFTQHYRSSNYRDTVRKRLLLQKRDGQWRIVGETSTVL